MSFRAPSLDDYPYLGEDPVGDGRTVIANMPVSIPEPPKPKKQDPQSAINEFWEKFKTKTPGKATTIIPQNEYAAQVAKRSAKAHATSTQASFEEAAALCKAKVAKIVKECRRVNQKYRDPHFDLELDLKWPKRDTLESLSNSKESPPPSDHWPQSAKRIGDIFDKPEFYIDGPTANDVRQGRDGDCWFLAALCTLSNKPSLIERVCVARDQVVGVYGFVFFRDGEWISEIIDDKLFLIKPDYDDRTLERILWEDRDRVNNEELYRKTYQSGSGSLYFAQCENENETWLPLLEKAYAKAHGDYSAIEGGWTGEGIEDLTGGVTSELYTTDILDKEYFWKDEVLKVNDEFLFSCSTGIWGAGTGERKGIIESHAYSVMRAVEIDGERLVLLKNPWGKGEWTGAWSDGSKEWTAEWLTKLNHKFGDDGAFWISYNDLLRKYQVFERTRLFGPEWKITQVWTTLEVPWTVDYHDTQFAFSISKPGPVVIVLSQLDDRYFQGLEGQYRYELAFRLHKSGQEDYVVRSIGSYGQTRSVNVELELEEGDYTVLLKITAIRDTDVLPIEEVVRKNVKERRDKLVSVGMSYDLAHSKGKIIETPEEKAARKEEKKRDELKAKKEFKKELMKDRKDSHYLRVKDQRKSRERKARRDARRKEKAELKKAEQEKLKAENAAKQKTAAIDGTPAQDNVGGKVDKAEKHVQILTPPAEGASAEMNTAQESPSKAPAEKATEAAGDTSVRTGSGQPTDQQQVSPDPASPSEIHRTSEPVADKIEEPKQAPAVNDAAKAEVPKGETSETKPASSEVVPSQIHSDNDIPTARPNVSDNESHLDGGVSDDDLTISSLSDLSDRELDILFERDQAAPPMGRPPPPPLQEPEEDEFEADPWNAVAVVGLKIYYKVADEDKDNELVKLRVVRPNPFLKKKNKDEESGSGDDEAELADDEKETKTGTKSKGLDVDDSAKDATLEGDAEQRRKSIAADAKKSQ